MELLHFLVIIISYHCFPRICDILYVGQLVQSLNQAGSYLRHTKPSICHEVTAVSLLCSVVPDERAKPNPPACESVHQRKVW